MDKAQDKFVSQSFICQRFSRLLSTFSSSFARGEPRNVTNSHTQVFPVASLLDAEMWTYIFPSV